MAGWSKSQWQRFIRQAAGEARNVIFTEHALLRMRQRQISRDAANPTVVVVTAIDLDRS